MTGSVSYRTVPAPDTMAAAGKAGAAAFLRTEAALSREKGLPPADSAGAGRTAPDAFLPSFCTAADAPAVPHPLPWREVSPRTLFGERSVLVPPPAAIRVAVPSPADSIPFQGIVLLLAVLYAMLLYRNPGDVRRLADRIAHNTDSGRRLPRSAGGSGFRRFLNLTAVIGMLFLGVAVVKCADLAVVPPLHSLLPQGAAGLAAPAVALLCTLVALVQTGMLRAAGALTLSEPLVGQLLLLRRTFFALAALANTPALLLFALSPRGTGGLWFCVLLIGSALVAVLYLRESLNLFVQKKVSILHWFLYLCTVEIFPVSYFCLLAAR